MITANEAKLTREKAMVDYCTKYIEPLIKNSNGTHAIYFGTYNKAGKPRKIRDGLYCNQPPYISDELYEGTPTAVEVMRYLKSIGYDVILVEAAYKYGAHYSSSRRTKYYDDGTIYYYTLKICF